MKDDAYSINDGHDDMMMTTINHGLPGRRRDLGSLKHAWIGDNNADPRLQITISRNVHQGGWPFTGVIILMSMHLEARTGPLRPVCCHCSNRFEGV
jgi:hypothetical protein